MNPVRDKDKIFDEVSSFNELIKIMAELRGEGGVLGINSRTTILSNLI